MKKNLSLMRGAVLASLLMGSGIGASAQLGSALDTAENATENAKSAQLRINQLDDERSDMIGDFRAIVQRTDSATLNVRRLEKAVESQLREVDSLTDQLARIDEITSVMVPMMLDMIDDLEAFVQADLPFRLEERRQRITDLRAVMTRADVVPAEQYRLIIDAYQSELETGNTIDTWTEEVEINGALTDVDMFRYGRVALVYLTPNGRYAARWDRDAAGWVELGASDREDVRQSIRVAQELVQPTIISAQISPLTVPKSPPPQEEVFDDATTEYRSVLVQTENLGIFSDQQELILQNQVAEIASLEDQIAVAPERMMEMEQALITMVADLRDFVSSDLPFHIEDRMDRIETLEAALERVDITVGEKYRLIIGAYQDEMAQGTVQEVWDDEINLGGIPTAVTLYRYGRVSLVYMTPDRNKAKFWDRQSWSWQDVPGSMRSDILNAIKIAEGRAQQTVLYGPVVKFDADSET